MVEVIGRKVHILGTPYKIYELPEKDDEQLKDCSGYCDWTTRTIVIEREAVGNLGDMERYIKKVLRHEIVHAFLFESGVFGNSGPAETWACNEEMVDWFAIQGPKVYEAWREAGALD